MKLSIAILFAAFCLTAFGQVPDYVPTDGLVAWYPLDGNAVDLSGSNADGILNGPEAALDRFNVESSALAFDGLDDWVGLGDLNPISEGTSGHASFSFWINVESLNASNLQAVLIGDEIYQNNGVLYQLANDYGFGAYVAGSSNWDGYCGCFPILNEWQHVVFVQGENGTDLYLDGQHLVNLLDDVFNNETTAPYRIGGFAPVFSSRFFDGRMDDLGIWSRALSEEEIQEVYLATPPVMGCTDESACNFDPEAVSDDGSCHFNCQFCLTGTVWSEELGGCIGDGSGDINLDGCVQLNDLLDLLSAFGDCAAEESAWQCGDPLEYQGYDYETIQIGEQCWFAENLRAENYRNGDLIPALLSDDEWATTNQGAVSVYGEDAGCDSSSPDLNPCDLEQALQAYGRLYNLHAVLDERRLCPNGWHSSSDADWMALEIELGMSESQVNSTGWRGADEGGQLKSSSGWAFNGNGSNSSGFSALPGGTRYPTPASGVEIGDFMHAGDDGYWWTSTTEETGISGWGRLLYDYFNTVARATWMPNHGMSVRCLKD